MKFSVEVCFDIFSIKFLLSVKLYYTAKIVTGICSVKTETLQRKFLCAGQATIFSLRDKVLPYYFRDIVKNDGLFILFHTSSSVEC